MDLAPVPLAALTSTGMAAPLLLVGLLVVAAILAKAALERLRVPALVGFLVLGVLVRVLDDQAGVPGDLGREVLHFLGKLGVIALLFRVGLESELAGLLRQLRSASIIWVGSVGVSGALGYWTAHALLGLPLIPSLVVGVAMTATSVGIPTLVWRESDALDTRTGERFLDVAEMDDISGVILLALLFAVVPVLRGSAGGADAGADAAAVAAAGAGGTGGLAGILLRQAGVFALKLAGLGLAAWAFGRWLEAPFTRFFRRLEPSPEPMLVVAGTGIVVAAVAGLLGFSVAIGAFVAGLAFSHDPRREQVQRTFQPLHELLTPFFFISVGLMIDPSVLPAATGTGAILLAAAIVGKVAGTGLPALTCSGRHEALVLGASMVPRAEITMLIVQKAQAAGSWAIGQAAYAGMVLVCAVTCVVGPLLLRWLLQRRRPS